MEFIKKMRKREFIEMSLKLLASLFAVFVAIILMESMIYSIKLNTLLNTQPSSAMKSSESIAYCIKVDDDQYKVIYYTPVTTENGEEFNWSSDSNIKNTKSREECEAINVKEVIFRAPNAFELVITPIHYVIMAVLILGVGGFFTYKFVKLGKEYNKIEDEFNKTGTIEISNK